MMISADTMQDKVFLSVDGEKIPDLRGRGISYQIEMNVNGGIPAASRGCDTKEIYINLLKQKGCQAERYEFRSAIKNIMRGSVPGPSYYRQNRHIRLDT